MMRRLLTHRITKAVGILLLGFLGMGCYRVCEAAWFDSSLYRDWAYLHGARLYDESHRTINAKGAQ